MSTKGYNSGLRNKLKMAIIEMSDEEAMDLFNRLAKKKAELGERPLEEPIYPIEFLNAMNETGFYALQYWLTAQKAPKDVRDLVDDLNVLNAWKREVDESGNAVGWHVNLFLQDTISSLTKHVASIGGTFYLPYGVQTPRRDAAK